jgi:hypothetical protein
MWELFRRAEGKKGKKRSKEYKLPTVSFATSVWEKEWKEVLLNPEYLEKKQIQYQNFHFQEKILILNNLDHPSQVKLLAEKFVEKTILTHVYLAKEYEQKILENFNLKKEDFKIGNDAHKYEGVNNDWIYYNALAPLAAIYLSTSDYLVYLTADVWLKEPVSWIDQALAFMQKHEKVKVANLTWNDRYDEAEKESYKKKKKFYLSKKGFSDQMFLVKREDFIQPIYSEVREDLTQFPRGDVFEKRVFSFMKNHGWERITYSGGSYTHQSFR